MTTMTTSALPTIPLQKGAPGVAKLITPSFFGVCADADIFEMPEQPRGYARYHGTLSAFWSKDPDVDAAIAKCLWDIPRLHKISSSPGARMISLATVSLPEVYEALETVAEQLGVPFRLTNVMFRYDAGRCHYVAARMLPTL